MWADKVLVCLAHMVAHNAFTTPSIVPCLNQQLDAHGLFTTLCSRDQIRCPVFTQYTGQKIPPTCLGVIGSRIHNILHPVLVSEVIFVQ